MELNVTHYCSHDQDFLSISMFTLMLQAKRSDDIDSEGYRRLDDPKPEDDSYSVDDTPQELVFKH